MDNLPSDVRSLIERARRHDGPTARDKERVDQKLNLALAAAGGAASLLVSKSATAFTTVAAGDATSAATSAVASASVASLSAGSAISPTATVAGAAAGVSTAGAAGTVGAVGVIAAKVAVGPATAFATKLGGGTVAAWLIGAGVVGAGAISAPQVVEWVRSETPAATPTPRESFADLAPPTRSPAQVSPRLPVTSGVVGTSVEVNPQPEGAADYVAPVLNSAVVPRESTPVAPFEERLGVSSANDAAEDLALLSQAQRASAEGDAGRALLLLREHGKRFPQSALSAERSAARVFAFCQLGRVEDARAAARIFFKHGAGSPLIPKVQASCIGDESKDQSTNSEGAGN